MPVSSCRRALSRLDPLPGDYRVKHIMLMELFERYAYYGSRAVLTLYLVDRLGFSEPQAVSAYSWYIALCYLSPLLGGYVGDVWWGKFRTVWVFSLVYAAGLLVLGTTALVDSTPGAVVGLGLMALGTGGIKPSCGPFGADQLVGADAAVESRFWLYWYASINLGSIWSYLVTPLIRANAGFPAAFLTSFGALLAALLVFLAPARSYVYVPPSGTSVYATIVRVLAAATGRGGAGSGGGGSGGGGYRTEHTPLIGKPGGAFSAVRSGGGGDGGSSASSAASGFTPLALGAPALVGSSAGAGSGLQQINSGGGYNRAPVGRAAEAAGDDGAAGAAGAEGHPTITVDSDVGSSGAGSSSGASSLDDGAAARGRGGERRGQDVVADDDDDGARDGDSILRDTSFSKGGKLAAFSRRSARWGGGGRGGGAVCCGAIRLDRARGTVPDGDIAGVSAFLGLVPLFGCLPMFWALFDAQDSLWTLQRRHMDLCLAKESGAGWCLTTEQLGVLNPVLVLLFVPLMDKVILPALTATRRPWLQPTPLRRMTVGMQLAAASFVLTALVQARLDASPEGTVPVLLQAPQFVVMATAEMLVSATGLEFAYSQAPPSMRGSIMALFFLMTFVGDSLNGALYGTLTAVLSPLQMLLLLAALMSASGLVFAGLAWRYRPVDPSVWGAPTPTTSSGAVGSAGAGTLSLAAEHGDGDARDGPGGSTAPSIVI